MIVLNPQTARMGLWSWVLLVWNYLSEILFRLIADTVQSGQFGMYLLCKFLFDNWIEVPYRFELVEKIKYFHWPFSDKKPCSRDVEPKFFYIYKMEYNYLTSFQKCSFRHPSSSKSNEIIWGSSGNIWNVLFKMLNCKGCWKILWSGFENISVPI